MTAQPVIPAVDMSALVLGTVDISVFSKASERCLPGARCASPDDIEAALSPARKGLAVLLGLRVIYCIFIPPSQMGCFCGWLLGMLYDLDRGNTALRQTDLPRPCAWSYGMRPLHPCHVV